ncbi:hypothetical protein QOZ80_9AG0677590 [Eleusine coracana subsp. coracana]|nr:hypothetical protein QOZ80_9AG0677590 [Eleusine coracana subsp. coracana]
MSFNDDEPIVPTDSGTTKVDVPGKVDIVPIKNEEAPLEENVQNVMLELIGAELPSKLRRGLDLVVVLDTSKSMTGKKIENLKIAMKFVIKKLSTVDRMCIVTFSDVAERHCPLRQITQACQEELQLLIDNLTAFGNTNIQDGLETGLKVLTDRTTTGERDIGIILMSDGKKNKGGDAAEVAIGNVPVYTFGFGEKHDPTVLSAVAKNSMGGTFSAVQQLDGLSLAFSQCLAGLLTVIVKDLTLTIAPIKDQSKIKKVTAGSYPQAPGTSTDSVTITFNDLYSREVRKVIVDLLLPATKKIGSPDILMVSYTYRYDGLQLDEPPRFFGINRTGTVDPQAGMPPDLETEVARDKTVAMIVEARILADNDNMDGALDTLVKAQNNLEDITEQSSPMVDMLRADLQKMILLTRSPKLYEEQGRAYALSSEISHNRRRFAARGDVQEMRLFATPRMDTYLEQAIEFNNDPAMPLPSADDDLKQEIAANPIAPIARTINYYIQVAIQALQAIEKVLGNA